MFAILLPIAHINDTGAGAVLTLVFPLAFVFVVFALWWVAVRRARRGG